LVSGHPVHEAGNAQQILVRAATMPARPLASVAPKVPPAIGRVVDRALAYEKSARWPTAGAMAEALREAWTAEHGSSAPILARLASRPNSLEISEHAAPHVGNEPSLLRAPNAVETDSEVPLSTPGVVRGKRRVLTTVIAGSTLAVGLGLAAFVKLQPWPAPREVRDRAETRATGGRLVAAVDIRATPPITTAPAPLAPSPVAAATAASPPSSWQTLVAKPTTPSRPAAVAPKSTSGSGANVRTTPPSTTTPTPSLSNTITSSGSPSNAATCNPNYSFDSEGNKHFKPECF
jgi:serine/threonine-protein kinase